MEHKFDCTIIKTMDGAAVEYGYLFGNEQIIFIKVGADEEIRKSCNRVMRYAELAARAHRVYGATVICASNPDIPHEELDEQAIRWVASQQGYRQFSLSLWGISDGAYQNLKLAKRMAETQAFIGVNPSFVTVTDFKHKLQALPDVKKFLIYGTKDDDLNVVAPALREWQNQQLKILFIDGADHGFADHPLPILHSIDLLYDDCGFHRFCCATAK